MPYTLYYTSEIFPMFPLLPYLSKYMFGAMSFLMSTIETMSCWWQKEGDCNSSSCCTQSIFTFKYYLPKI